MLNLKIGFDESDNLFRQLLLDAYDNILAYTYGGWVHPNDIKSNAEILHAVSVLMDYISVGNDGQKALEDLHDKYRYKDMVSKMGEVRE